MPEIAVHPDVIIAMKGTSHQRNVGLDSLDHDTGTVIFFDDDYVPAPNALEAVEVAFDTFGDSVAGMSGHLIADGISGPGISHDDALRMISNHMRSIGPKFLQARKFAIKKDTVGLYGCNMAFRVEAIGDTRFDENLPLYGWQEDVDFSYRTALVSGKRMVLTNAFCGVHRGVKNGREQRGTKLGYSQIANNWYLWKKGHLPGTFALRLALGNVTANHVKMIRSEPWVDRRGRAQGNRMAILDILLGRADPQRVHRI
jgi:GT2 family glycosyltransferase